MRETAARQNDFSKKCPTRIKPHQTLVKNAVLRPTFLANTGRKQARAAPHEKKRALLSKKTRRFAEQKREFQKKSGHSRHSGHSGSGFREVVIKWAAYEKSEDKADIGGEYRQQRHFAIKGDEAGI